MINKPNVKNDTLSTISNQMNSIPAITYNTQENYQPINMKETNLTSVQTTFITPDNSNENTSQANFPQANNDPTISIPEPRKEHSKDKVTGKKSKATSKQCLGTTEDEIAAEFTKAQMKTLQIKLKEQESSLKDLKFQNTVLLERIAVLEKPQKQTVFSSYFPDQEHNGTDHHNCAYHSNSCFSMPSCCRPQNFCMSIQHQLCTITNKLDDILSSKTSSSSDNKHNTEKQQHSRHARSTSSRLTEGAPNTLPPEVEANSENSISNDSIVSIDHFMPDAERDISLNSNVMTSRPAQPMLL